MESLVAGVAVFQTKEPNVDHENGFRQAPWDESILHQHTGMEMVRAGIHPQISDPQGGWRGGRTLTSEFCNLCENTLSVGSTLGQMLLDSSTPNPMRANENWVCAREKPTHNWGIENTTIIQSYDASWLIGF